jgi:hypothetical protein
MDNICKTLLFTIRSALKHSESWETTIFCESKQFLTFLKADDVKEVGGKEEEDEQEKIEPDSQVGSMFTPEAPIEGIYIIFYF